MNKKYKLTNEILKWRGRTLHRIRALRDFGNVRAGDLGGWVESEDNLSHRGDCWLYGEAKAYDAAFLFVNACAYDNARLSGNARASGNALLFNNSRLSGNASASGNARLYGSAYAFGNSLLFANACAPSGARLSDDMYATKKVIYIDGLGWPVTISDNHIRIGYEVHTIDEWAAFPYREIALMSPEILGFWERWKIVIMAAAFEHQREVK